MMANLSPPESSTFAGVGRGDRPLFVNNVAKKLSLSCREVRHLAQLGKLPGFKPGRKIWRFRKVDVELYLSLREGRDAW
jgi:excisionase family DNA binding protein